MKPGAIRWAGDRSVLLEFAALEEAMAASSLLRDSPLPGQLDVITGARTVLVRMSTHGHALRAHAALRDRDFPPMDQPQAGEIVIEVAYDGPDLDDVAAELGMSTEALIAWHSDQAWMGAFAGFAGFTYCVTHGQPQQVPRRSSPRTAVPGGSVALAGEFSGVYPRRAPGGWQLIGRTDAVMWDLLAREVPSLVQPWDAVRYRPVRSEAVVTGASGTSRTAERGEAGAPTEAARARDQGPEQPEQAERPGALEILDPGLQTLIEDFGREGAASVGAGISGVMDRIAARAANHSVGNHAAAPVLESLFGGLHLQARRTVVLAVAGADVDLTVESEQGPTRRPLLDRPFVLLAGEALRLGVPHSGARSVLAVRGGISAPETLGSVSTDTHIEIGPAPLQSGDVIDIGDAVAGAVVPAVHHSSIPDRDDEPGVTSLRFVYGPREDWFSPAERRRLAEQRWIVSPASNRIGIRLGVDPEETGACPLQRCRDGELLSEGMALGALQVPPAGSPVLLVNDQAITGGYPIIGVVLSDDLSRAAQLTPGRAVRFAPVDPISLRPLDIGGQQS